MQYLKAKLFLFIFLLQASLVAQGNTGLVYPIDTLRQVHDLTPFAYTLVDTTRQIADVEITAGKRDDLFMPLSAFEQYNKPKSHYWLRVDLKALQDLENWWLIIKTESEHYEYYSQWEIMEAYVLDSSRTITDEQKSGVYTPRSKRNIDAPAGFVAANISMHGGEHQIIYIKLAGVFQENVVGGIRLELRDPAITVPTNSLSNLLYSLSAIAAVLSVLSFFFFIFVREKAYLFFFIYLVFLSLHYLILHPQVPFADWFIPEHPTWILYIFNFLGIGGFIMFLLFGRYFINLPALSQKTDRLLMWFLAAWASFIVLETLLMMVLQRSVLFDYAFVFLIIAFGFIVRFAFFNNILARFFVAGAAWLIVFSLLGLLGEKLFNNWNFNPWPVGQIGQILIYLAGLAYKIRLSEQAKAEALRIRDLDEIKSRFFANISHEFRTPLTLIRGMVQQINEKTTARQKHEDAITITQRQLGTISRHADRLLELVNQLLDLSRLDSGKMKLQIIRGDVLQVLKTLSHAFDSMAERKQIHYRVHFPDQTQIAFFDHDKLEKIFTNLLSNAFKYTPERGTVSVDVSLEEGRLRIVIEDSGPGIPKKELDKIFDRFYQVEGTEDKGSGIGLALVKELTELYRGQISVSSDFGKGTQFRISLPVNKDAFRDDEIVYGEWNGVPDHNIITDEPHVNGTKSPDMSPDLPLMLVVEDNHELRQFITESVQLQYNVLEATNGNEGFQTAAQEIPDIIISDVMMPGMDGFAFCEKLKKDDRTSHIPVILLTAKAGQPHKLEGLSTGADDYITKPFDVKELLQRAKNLIEGRMLLRKKFAGQITLKPSEVSPASMESRFLQKVMDSIEAHMHEEQFGVEELAREVAMSRSQLHRKLVALIGKSPSEILRQTRLLRAKELLEKKSTTPSEVAFRVGFNSHSYFSKCFKEEFGVSPSEV